MLTLPLSKLKLIVIMRKATQILIMLFVFFVELPAWAGPRSFTQAQMIAEAKAKSLGIVIDSKARAKAKVLNRTQTQQTADYYVFPNGSGKGFTIVSGDDCMPEIVGYADCGTYDETQIPEGMKAFLDSYKAMVEAVKAGNKRALSTLAEYNEYKKSPMRTTEAVSPLLGNIQWNQGFPYNYFCPLYDGTNRSATGCVATAMAQIMAYWKYPASLKADIPAYTTATNKIDMEAISAGETYDWDNMLSQYKNNYTYTQAYAVAKLMLHCGAAINMNYGSSSGANLYPDDLAKFFGYDADLMAYVQRTAVSLAKWTELIDNELKAKRPIYYSGFSSDGGHAFVCDGSDSEGLYHINWGWGGYQDGYFDITILNPEKGGIGSGNAADGFNSNCAMIIGIQPDNGIKDEPLIEIPLVQVMYYESEDFTTGMEITQGTRYFQNGKFELNIQDAFFSTAGRTVNAKLGYGISDGNDGYTILTETDMKSFSKGTGEANSSTFKFAPKPGTYTIYALYCKEGETTWNKCLYADGMYPYTFTATATELTQASMLTATLKANDELHAYQTNTFKMTITNNSDDEYIGDINLYWSDSNEACPETEDNTCHVTVSPHSSITRDVILNTTYQAPGDIYVWIKNTTGSELLSAEKFTLGEPIVPVLVLVSVETNATPDDYETENAYYFGYKVKTPKVNDDYVKVRYGFKNVGVDEEIRYDIYATNTSTGDQYNKAKGLQTIHVPADGTVTYLEETWTPDEVGGYRTILCGIDIRMKDSDESPWALIQMKNYYYWLLLVDDETQGFRNGANYPVVYVAGKPTAVDNIEASNGFAIIGGKGYVTIRTDKTEILTVYSVDGRTVAQVTVEAGSEKSISLPAGIYVVKGKKAVVR